MLPVQTGGRAPGDEPGYNLAMTQRKQMAQWGDDQLVEASRAGENVAVEVLLTRYNTKLNEFFNSKLPPTDADELTQKALDVLHGRLRGGELPLGTFRGFVYGVARRLLLNFFSTRARAREFDPDVQSIVDLDPSITRQLSRHRHIQWLRAVLEELPLETQTLLELRYVQGLTYPEIAEIYGIPVGTATSRIRMAKEKLAARRPQQPG